MNKKGYTFKSYRILCKFKYTFSTSVYIAEKKFCPNTQHINSLLEYISSITQCLTCWLDVLHKKGQIIHFVDNTRNVTSYIYVTLSVAVLLPLLSLDKQDYTDTFLDIRVVSRLTLLSNLKFLCHSTIYTRDII